MSRYSECRQMLELVREDNQRLNAAFREIFPLESRRRSLMREIQTLTARLRSMVPIPPVPSRRPLRDIPAVVVEIERVRRERRELERQIRDRQREVDAVDAKLRSLENLREDLRNNIARQNFRRQRLGCSE